MSEMNDDGRSGPTATVRVATWNLWWRFGADWPKRHEAIAATLAGLTLDIAGFQEVWAGDGQSQAGLLADGLGFHSAFAGPSLPPPPSTSATPSTSPEASGHEGIELGVAVISRWPIRHCWTHRLPSSRPEPPVALVATIDLPDGPLQLVCSCVEFEPELADDHQAQTRRLAQLVRDLAERDGAPVMLTADLNAAPGTPEVEALTATMTDAWIANGDDAPGFTLSSANHLAPPEAHKQLDQRIDYILVRPGENGHASRVADAFVVDVPVDGVQPSDHYAVVADVVW